MINDLNYCSKVVLYFTNTITGNALFFLIYHLLCTVCCSLPSCKLFHFRWTWITATSAQSLKLCLCRRTSLIRYANIFFLLFKNFIHFLYSLECQIILIHHCCWIIILLLNMLLSVNMHTVITFVEKGVGATAWVTLPYLRSGQALTPAQRWGRISSAQCASPNVTTRLQVAAIKP